MDFNTFFFFQFPMCAYFNYRGLMFCPLHAISCCRAKGIVVGVFPTEFIGKRLTDWTQSTVVGELWRAVRELMLGKWLLSAVAVLKIKELCSNVTRQQPTVVGQYPDNSHLPDISSPTTLKSSPTTADCVQSAKLLPIKSVGNTPTTVSLVRQQLIACNGQNVCPR